MLDNKITDFADLFRLLYDKVDDWGKGHVAECILIIIRYELSDSQVVDKEINICNVNRIIRSNKMSTKPMKPIKTPPKQLNIEDTESLKCEITER